MNHICYPGLPLTALSPHGWLRNANLLFTSLSGEYLVTYLNQVELSEINNYLDILCYAAGSKVNIGKHRKIIWKRRVISSIGVYVSVFCYI